MQFEISDDLSMTEQSKDERKRKLQLVHVQCVFALLIFVGYILLKFFLPSAHDALQNVLTQMTRQLPEFSPFDGIMNAIEALASK